MLVFKFSTLVLVLCVTVCLANKEAFYAEVLKKSLDARTLNLTMARSATMRVTIPSTLQLEFNGMHLLHYMLDLFMRSRNVQQRKEIIDLTVLMIEKGGDVLAVQRNQPDLVLKSIIIRQMKLAKRLAERGAPPELSSALLQMIYSVPCDTVPLAKLLLHADTIVRHSIASAANSTTAASVGETREIDLFPSGALGVRNLIASASLQVGAKPAVTGTDFALFSESYLSQSEKIGTRAMRDTGVSLTEIIRFLDEVGNVIHDDILKSKLVSEGALSASDFIEILKDSDENNRSPLHLLALSGATAMFHSLIDALLPSLAAASQEHSPKVLSDSEKSVASLLIDGLVQQDIRGHSPISYLLMRYGEVGAVGRLLEKLKTVFAAAGVSLSVFTLPYSTDRHTSPAVGATAAEAAAAAKAAATKDAGGWNTDKLPSALLYFPQYNSSTTGSFDSETAYAAAREQAQSADRCDILEHYGPMPSAEEFYRVYLSTGTPVIFRGAALGSTIRQNLQKNKFVKEFGKENVVISNLPYAGSFGVKGRTGTLAEAAELKYTPPSYSEEDGPAKIGQTEADITFAGCTDNVVRDAKKLAALSSGDAPQYVFTTGDVKWRERLHRTAPMLPTLSDLLEAFTELDQNSKQTKESRSMSPAPDTYKTLGEGESAEPKDDKVSASGTSTSQMMTLESLLGVLELQFYLGPLGSGAPVHFHTHAVNTLAYGEKRWFMFPPGESFYSTKPALEFGLTDPKSASALQCTQRAGDVIYVPSLWGHATLNMQQSIGVAHEFSLEPLCML